MNSGTHCIHKHLSVLGYNDMFKQKANINYTTLFLMLNPREHTHDKNPSVLHKVLQLS